MPFKRRVLPFKRRGQREVLLFTGWVVAARHTASSPSKLGSEHDTTTMAPPAAPTGPSNRGPDGETIVDMSYCPSSSSHRAPELTLLADEILGLRGDADAVAIKKAYRKAAIRWHPDKNVGDPTAAAKFQDISEAYA